ncbi:MAG: hypothetical protein QG628_535 [Patescibacteria group bacterium]|nr:hypothetical protein [Patescibacteria group bacterium]
MTTQDPFEQYSQSITFAAGGLYAAEKGGAPLDSSRSLVSMLPQDLGDASPDAMAEATRAQAEFNVAARAVARLALIQDDIEAGGLKGVFARVENRLTRVIDRKYLTNVDPIVDTIRGKATQ